MYAYNVNPISTGETQHDRQDDIEFQNVKLKQQKYFHRDIIYVSIFPTNSHGFARIEQLNRNEYESTGSSLTKEQITLQFNLEQLLPEAPKISSTKNQIIFLRKKMGLTISEIGQIMDVSRRAVYDWIENDTPKLRSENQIRLDDVCELAEYWGKKKLGRLGSYLRKKISNEDISLFSLLLDKKLKKDKIRNLLDQIESSISKEIREKIAHETLLKRHGFEKISDEEMNKSFNNIVQKIG